MSKKNRQPSDFSDVDFYEASAEVDLFSWSESPEGDPNPKPPSQVHMHIPLGGGKARLMMRFKGPGTLDKLIDALIAHRKDVWGKRVWVKR